MTDVFGGTVLFLMAVSLVGCLYCAIRDAIRKARRRRRSAWYRRDTAIRFKRDVRDWQGLHREAEPLPSILRRQAE